MGSGKTRKLRRSMGSRVQRKIGTKSAQRRERVRSRLGKAVAAQAQRQ